jgi:prefoldin subunit 5
LTALKVFLLWKKDFFGAAESGGGQIINGASLLLQRSPNTMSSVTDNAADSSAVDGHEERTTDEEGLSNIGLDSITETGKNDRGIPATRFIDDIESFANSFDPPASSELLIGAYSDLFSKFKAYEQQLEQKRGMYREKLPEIEKSITLVRHLKGKKDAGDTVITRYNLADTIYAKAEVDCSQGIVNLWLGANVMLEYTYDEALELLTSKQTVAKKDYKEVRVVVVA